MMYDLYHSPIDVVSGDNSDSFERGGQTDTRRTIWASTHHGKVCKRVSAYSVLQQRFQGIHERDMRQYPLK